jgi:glycosyltransferase involved in cell wall biosynthesis
MFYGLIGWLVRHNWRNPKHLVKSMLLIPRALDIFFDLSANPPDVIHLFWGHYPAIVGYLAYKYFPRSILSLFVGAYDLRTRYQGTASVARVADVIWTHAQANVPTIESMRVPPQRVRVVYRGIDLEHFHAEADSRVPHRILTAGHLIAVKAMEDVIATFTRIRNHWPSASLVILGDGPDQDRLKVLAHESPTRASILFRGHVSHDEVAIEMARADVFLLMSKVERLPNVVKEAMASDCVCIVTDTPGIEELIEDGVSGFIVPQGGIEQATRRIHEVFRDPNAARDMRAAARRQVTERFDVRNCMLAYLHHWRHLIAEKRESMTASVAATPGLDET